VIYCYLFFYLLLSMYFASIECVLYRMCSLSFYLLLSILLSIAIYVLRLYRMCSLSFYLLLSMLVSCSLLRGNHEPGRCPVTGIARESE
jgi:hypothetical protein